MDKDYCFLSSVQQDSSSTENNWYVHAVHIVFIKCYRTYRKCSSEGPDIFVWFISVTEHFFEKWQVKIK